MALNKNFEYEHYVAVYLPWEHTQEKRTITLENAYIKVVSTEGTKHRQRAAVQISSGEKQLTKNYDFVPDLDGPNFIAQAYAHLKTLPEFKDAVEC